MNARISDHPETASDDMALGKLGSPAGSRRLPIRTLVNLAVDALLLVILLFLGWESVIIRFIFPPGPAAAGWKLWGWGFDEWSTAQFATLGLFFFTALIHVMLHWSWVCGVVSACCARGKREKIDDGLQTIYGVGFMIILAVIVGAGLMAALFSLQRPPI